MYTIQKISRTCTNGLMATMCGYTEEHNVHTVFTWVNATPSIVVTLEWYNENEGFNIAAF